MIRNPKKVELKEGSFGGGKLISNFAPVERDYSYLLSLCGFDSLEIEEKKCCCDIGEDGYVLDIANDSISVCVKCEEGLSNALKMLAVLKEKHGDAIPCMKIIDEPDIKFRGMHLCIFNPDDGTEKEDTNPEDIKRRIIKAALAGYNYIFMEFWGMFPYKKRPYAAWPKAYTRETVEEIISLAIDKLHITPLPCQNLTSHAGWSRITSRKHVVLDQRPDLADMWVPGGWCFATENPDTQEYLRDIMDDLLETFRNPPYLHASCDKCFGFGSTEEDRTKPADILFANHLCRLNTYLQEKGTRMVMWGDMLYSSMDSLTWKPNPIIADMLPKNILINVWTHNDIGDYWADVDFFESRGYQTVYSPFINRKGTENMVKLCRRKGSLGIVQTTWHRPETAFPSAMYSALVQWNGEIHTPKEEELYERLF